jgi:hypothetical protein
MRVNIGKAAYRTMLQWNWSKSAAAAKKIIDIL